MPTFPRTFPFAFPGAFAPIEGYEEIEGTTLAWVPSHCESAKALPISQFRGKPRLEGFLCALCDGIAGEGGIQELENATWQCLTERWLDTAEGVQLDLIGRIVNLPRAGWSDGTYSLLLGAQILVLISKGRWPNLLAILDVLGITVALTRIVEPGMAAMRIELGEPLLDEIRADDVFRLLVKAKPAGVRFTFVFPTVDVDESFTFAESDEPELDFARGAGGSYTGTPVVGTPVLLSSNSPAGAYTVFPLSLSSFPEDGPFFVQLDNGVDSEIVEVLERDPTPLILARPVIASYPAGPSTVALVTGLTPIGGALAGALATTETV